MITSCFYSAQKNNWDKQRLFMHVKSIWGNWPFTSVQWEQQEMWYIQSQKIRRSFIYNLQDLFTCRIPTLMNDCRLHIIHSFQFFSYLSMTHKVPSNEVIELEYVSIAIFSHFKKSHINRKIHTSFKNRL